MGKNSRRFLSVSVGQFQNGIAEGEVEASFGPLEAMRLSVLTDSPVWVILSEVGQKNIFTVVKMAVCCDGKM